MPLPKRTRFESAAAPSASVQPNSALLRPMTQPATSGPSWPGLATGFVGVALAPPRPPPPPKPPRPPAGGAYLIGASPSTQLTDCLMAAACFSQVAAEALAKFVAARAGALGFSPLLFFHSS